MKCLICGTVNRPEATSCKECGLVLENNDTILDAGAEPVSTESDIVRYLINLLWVLFGFSFIYALINFARVVFGFDAIFLYNIMQWVYPLVVVGALATAAIMINNKRISRILVFFIIIQIVSSLSYRMISFGF